MMLRVFALALLLSFATTVPAAERLEIAVASSAAAATRDVAATFTRKTGIAVTVTEGASGRLAAQIREGSREDIFLSADMALPSILVAEGLASGTPIEYARGRPVVWTLATDIPLADWQQQARSQRVKKIAVPDAGNSPYGREAQRVIDALGLSARLQEKMTSFDNVAAVNQAILSGAADIGITSRSSVFAPANRARGTWVELPPDSYNALPHGAVMLRHGTQYAPQAAQKFLDFLQDPAARDILRRHGFDLP